MARWAVEAAVLHACALSSVLDLDVVGAARAPFTDELGRLASVVLPTLHGHAPSFAIRQLDVIGGRLLVDPSAAPSAPAGLQADSCVVLDVYTGLPSADQQADQQAALPGQGAPAAPGPSLDTVSLRQPPYDACSYRVLWARGRGGSLDWMPGEPRLCELYNSLLIEDEFLLDRWRARPPPCIVHVLNPHEVLRAELVPIPWMPGEPLPIIDKALVSFHAYSVYENDAQSNPQRWLHDPDKWNPHFVELATQGFLHLCLKRADCDGDDRPFRLMFWEDVGAEFIDCVARGITPIYFATPAILEYIERNVLLTPYMFGTPEEMRTWVRLVSTPEGVFEYGTKIFMQRQSNHILANLYWRQDARLRAILGASAAYQQRFFVAGKTAPDGARHVAEILVCVVSAVSNYHLRKLIRETWGRGGRVQSIVGMVRLRVFFFLGDTPEARDENALTKDIVLLRGLDDTFGRIWVKTAAIMKFGADHFRRRGKPAHQAPGRSPVRFLMKCDDDAFIDMDMVTTDLLANAPAALYWGHVMALVEPNRIVGDKYYVPNDVYPMQYYPPYARGMAYALSEDLVMPLGRSLHEGVVAPFPYREDVSIGLYLLALATRGDVRVVPRQRKNAMPLDISQHCAAPPPEAVGGPLLVLHRFRPADAPCFWGLIEKRRAAQGPPSGEETQHVDFCQCVQDAV